MKYKMKNVNFTFSIWVFASYIHVGDERAPEPSPRNFGKTPRTVI